FFEIATDHTFLMLKNPCRDAGLLQIIFLAQTEKLRLRVAVHRDKFQSVLFRLMKKEGSAVEGDDATNGLISRSEERLLSKVVDDRVVDLEKAAFPLLAPP